VVNRHLAAGRVGVGVAAGGVAQEKAKAWQPRVLMFTW
jgi:hypothetical protein